MTWSAPYRVPVNSPHGPVGAGRRPAALCREAALASPAEGRRLRIVRRRQNLALALRHSRPPRRHGGAVSRTARRAGGGRPRHRPHPQSQSAKRGRDAADRIGRRRQDLDHAARHRRLGPAFAPASAARRPPAHDLWIPPRAVRQPGAHQRRPRPHMVRRPDDFRRRRRRRLGLSVDGGARRRAPWSPSGTRRAKTRRGPY